ncbi:MAG TPA: hypothetical protein PKA64_23060, partial [Myxococcota bacterium]|nr:hypothetical protein [Myxococcota bacterium]
LPAAHAPPPGQTMTLSGAAAIVSGEALAVDVTSPSMQVGDRVDLIAAERTGAGPCPMRQVTGGSPCLDITGGVSHRASAFAEVDALAPTGVAAHFSLPFGWVTETAWLQAFRASGGASETSNVWEVAVAQPYPELEPRVTDVEDQVATMQATIDDLAATVDDLNTAVAGLTSVSGMAMAYIQANNGTPSIRSQTSTFLASVSDGGVGAVTLNFAPGWTSQTPYCVCTSQHNPSIQHMTCNIHLPGAGGFVVATAGVDGTAFDRDFWIVCMPR